jgi:glucose-1-phosphate cytidylyltransferase
MFLIYFFLVFSLSCVICRALSKSKEREVKVAILAGGLGTRLSEETGVRPKPLVEIGGKPVIWHVMKHYEHHGFKDFVVALGYKKEAIIEYFLNLHAFSSDVTVRLRDGAVECRRHDALDWTVELIDTGPLTMSGGRIKRLARHLGNETFMLTWCDGVSNVDLTRLLAVHRAHGKLATVTAVRPPARFGHLALDNDCVIGFAEKPEGQEGWINGAFFVLEPQVVEYVAGDDTAWEREPLERLAAERQLVAYKHPSFWQCMDTLRDKQRLEELWSAGNAPWKTWE